MSILSFILDEITITFHFLLHVEQAKSRGEYLVNAGQRALQPPHHLSQQAFFRLLSGTQGDKTLFCCSRRRTR